MPKGKNSSTSKLQSKYEDLNKQIDQQMTVIDNTIVTESEKKKELLRRHANRIKHTKIRDLFRNLTKASELQKTVAAIDSSLKEVNTKTQKTKGQEWEDKYIANLADLCALTGYALTTMNKYLEEKDKEKKPYVELKKKVDTFFEECLAKIREIKMDTQKPFEISANTSVKTEYAYSNTPFQCYQ